MICGIKFKDFQAPVLFSITFKTLNLGEKNSSIFKYFQGCVGTLLGKIAVGGAGYGEHLKIKLWTVDLIS